MHHSKTVFDKAFAHAEHTECLFDMKHQLIALVDNHQQILGALQFELRDDKYAQIETLATAAGKKGLWLPVVSNCACSSWPWHAAYSSSLPR